MRKIESSECYLRNKLKENQDNQNYYCPDGYRFWSNIDFGSKHVEKYQETINNLRNHGYLVQVAEPFDVYGRNMSFYDYYNLAIYIRREDGEEFEEGEIYNSYDCWR